MIRNLSTDTHHFFLTDEFSQWYPGTFQDEKGRSFHCREQWMMVNKAELFGDSATAAKIMKASTPKQCKDFGREVSPFNPPAWDAVAFDIVLKGTLMQFSQNPHLWAAMDATGNLELVEAASYDKVWGIGLGAEDAAALNNPAQWRGRNLLGQANGAARSALRANPALLSAPADARDLKTLRFYDADGQRAIRFSEREMENALGLPEGGLEARLAALGEAEVSMSLPAFVKRPMGEPASSLLSQLRSSRAPAVASKSAEPSAARAPK